MSKTVLDDGTLALARRIELWPIDRPRPYARNPRTHDSRQVQQLAASIAEFGWTNPILVDEGGGILAGHGRLMAARELGLQQVPVIRLEHLNEAQRRAYLLADNRLALDAGWDEQLLGEELAWLREVRFDLDILGFDGTEIEKLLALVDAEPLAEEDEDDVPSPPAEAVTQLGDLCADSDEAGRLFQSEAGHLFRREAGQGSDFIPATPRV
jgi:ParB-like chromosome segregation protein Spo0J